MDRHCNQSPSAYKVLNHGDIWINNIMFTYNEAGHPVDLVLIDFQMSFYTSPGIDFNYFFCTSPQNEVREHRRDHLFNIYHKSFVKVLRKLRSPMAEELTAEVVRKEIQTRELFGIMAASGLLPMIMIDDAFQVPADRAMVRRALFHNPLYVRAIKLIVRLADEHGAFASFQ